MVTTIQLDENIKEQLTELARNLERDLKEKITYNDVIKYLLEISPIIQEKKQLKRLRGILPYNLAKKALEELKELEKKKETRFQR